MGSKAEQRTYNNPAIQLHAILNTLDTESRSGKHNQRNVLCKVLQVPKNDVAILYGRLAELYRLPMHVRRSLVRAGADHIFLEWAGPVENAISELNGSVSTNLVPFRDTAGLPEAVVKLYMCRTMLDAQDSLEVEQLSGIRDAIGSALSSVADADDIDPDLSEWLESTLQEADSVVADAEAVGVHAARDKLCTIIGRTRLAPCPRATGDAEKTAVETVIKVFDRLVAVVNVGLKIRGLLTE